MRFFILRMRQACKMQLLWCVTLESDLWISHYFLSYQSLVCLCTGHQTFFLFFQKRSKNRKKAEVFDFSALRMVHDPQGRKAPIFYTFMWRSFMRRSVAQWVIPSVCSWPGELITTVGGWGFNSCLGRCVIPGRLGFFSGYSNSLPFPQVSSK